ncbi:BT_3987 domain-containing protein [Parabacteroides sp. AM08-6]|uniref:BT_3987 domain-containing protein n=1 Tax=Parabacteroides sp. AM08-6 TaxID=2292053 RepID=UPI000F010714|nr:DUF1735 domain-containing protein [Parabacteroides sp. AM08-6]RHJ86594.1 DUF1735 domain-containing protein [Parabacteroides sp. AM08-6]
MKQRIIYLLGILLAFFSCEDSLKKDYPDIKSYLVINGMQSFEMYDLRNVGQQIVTYDLPIQCSGVENLKIQAKLRVSSERLSEYNTMNYTSFRELPASCYKILNQEVVFESKKEAGIVSVEFNMQQMVELVGLGNSDFILPLELYDTPGLQINEDINLIFLNPVVHAPFIQFETSGLKELAIEAKDNNILAVPVKIPFKTPVNSGFELGINTRTLEEYNKEHGSSVELLQPQYYRQENETVISANEQKAIVNFKLNVENLPFGTYMLPFELVSSEHFPITEGENKLNFLLNYLPPEVNRSIWTVLSGQSITHPTDGGGIPALLDDNMDTYWHAYYDSPFPVKLEFDMNKLYEISRFEIVRRQSTYGPAQIDTDITIELSENGTDWVTFDDVTTKYLNVYQGFNIPPTKARYVRFMIKSGVRHMAEFRLRGNEVL